MKDIKEALLSNKKKIIYVSKYFDENGEPYYVDDFAKPIKSEETNKGITFTFPIIEKFEDDTLYLKMKPDIDSIIQPHIEESVKPIVDYINDEFGNKIQKSLIRRLKKLRKKGELKKNLKDSIYVEPAKGIDYTPRFYTDKVTDIQRVSKEQYFDIIYSYHHLNPPILKSEEVTLTIKLISAGNTTTWTNEDIKKWIENKIND